MTNTRRNIKDSTPALCRLAALLSVGALLLMPLSGCSSTMDPNNIPKPPVATTNAQGETEQGLMNWGNVDNPDEDLTEAARKLRDYDMGVFAGASDILNAFYSFDVPENYYTAWPTQGLYFPEEDAYQNASQAYAEYGKIIADLDRSELTEEQIRVVEYMCYDFKYMSEMYRYPLYVPQLYPMGGKQIVYPLLTSLIPFRSKEDVERYLLILGDYYTFFEKAVDAEKKRSEAGVGWNDENLDRIIEDCAKMQDNRDSHFMKTTFETRLESLDLSEQEKEDYKKRNQELLDTVYFPTMEMLIERLTELKGMCNDGPYLAETADGKAYYEALFHQKTGVEMSVSECTELLEQEIAALYDEYLPRWKQNGSYFSFGDLSIDDAIEWCKRFSAQHFPEIRDNEVTIYDVPVEFAESMQPASYYLSPIDNYTKHTVWVNRGMVDAPNYDMFTLVSHEMYPGHLYQHQYQAEHLWSKYQVFATSEPYAEGWAQYAEWTMIHYAPFDQEQAENAWKASLLFSSFIPARLSIGVEYEGWTREDCDTYLAHFGQDSADVQEEYWKRVTGEQCYGLEYAFGYIFTAQILDKAVSELDGICTKDDVMKAYLDLGCAPFAVLSEDMDKYVAQMKG
ncbi:MAG: DUF885 family protein [Clostridiales bacterium]|nr:DUF885 family protein [Clostridiales bacterium]